MDSRNLTLLDLGSRDYLASSDLPPACQVEGRTACRQPVLADSKGDAQERRASCTITPCHDWIEWAIGVAVYQSFKVPHDAPMEPCTGWVRP